MGIRMEQAGDGEAISILEPGPEVCWPFPGQPHGGILFTQMDTTMAMAVFARLDTGYNCATIQLDIHYTSPAKGDRFTCLAKISHQTTHLSFVQAEIRDMEDNLVAKGQATLRVIKSDVLDVA